MISADTLWHICCAGVIWIILLCAWAILPIPFAIFMGRASSDERPGGAS